MWLEAICLSTWFYLIFNSILLVGLVGLVGLGLGAYG